MIAEKLNHKFKQTLGEVYTTPSFLSKAYQNIKNFQDFSKGNFGKLRNKKGAPEGTPQQIVNKSLQIAAFFVQFVDFWRRKNV